MYIFFRVVFLSIFLSRIGLSLADTLEGSIQIKGSDTMVNLVQAWAEVFTQRHPEVNIAVTGGGSGTGIASLLNGTCDIAPCSRRMRKKERHWAELKGIKITEYIVAQDGVVVVVHPDNPIDKLTILQLRNIFTGKIKSWEELGWEKESIVVLSREVNSGTHVFFKNVVLRSEKDPYAEFSPSALLMPSSQAISDEVAQNKSAIGYYGMGYISKRQKVISLALSEGGPYIAPSLANVKEGRYPISRPLFIYVGRHNDIIKAFLDFVLSPEGQDIVEREHFVPIK